MQRLHIRVIERLGKGEHKPPPRCAAAELGEIDDAGERVPADQPAERPPISAVIETSA